MVCNRIRVQFGAAQIRFGVGDGSIRVLLKAITLPFVGVVEQIRYNGVGWRIPVSVRRALRM